MVASSYWGFQPTNVPLTHFLCIRFVPDLPTAETCLMNYLANSEAIMNYPSVCPQSVQGCILLMLTLGVHTYNKTGSGFWSLQEMLFSEKQCWFGLIGFHHQMLVYHGKLGSFRIILPELHCMHISLLHRARPTGTFLGPFQEPTEYQFGGMDSEMALWSFWAKWHSYYFPLGQIYSGFLQM